MPTGRHPLRAAACAAGVLGALLAAAPPAAALSAADVYRRAAPSVVFVFAAQRASGMGSTGTGSLVTADGLVLTNRHVLVDEVRGAPFKVIEVYFRPERPTGDPGHDLAHPHRARLVASSESLDLALLRVDDPPPRARPLVFGDSSSVSVGDPVAAIGHPTGGGLWTLTTGTISGSKWLGARDTFQTEAAFNPGNSGGPLLDARARLVGVNTSIVRRAEDGTPLVGLNFSIKSDVARQWLAERGVHVAAEGAAPRVAGVTPQPAAEERAPTGGPREPVSEPARPRRQGPPVAPRATPAPGPSPADEHAREMERDLLGPGPGGAPRAFRGPDGARMYGLPDPGFDLDEVKRILFERARSHADAAFEALDEN